MTYFADLHVHSRHSRATSRGMTPEGIWRGAQRKGIAVMGTGDFTHPAWFGELREKLEPAGNGLYRLRDDFQTRDIPASCRAEVFFVLSAEISCIYGKGGKTRKVHAVLLAPDLASAARIALALGRIGNLASDGRPILGLNAKELLAISREAAPEAVFLPAHAWTPHFSVFGAASGFDSLEECFEERTPEICAVETGLSSDPPMNWRLSRLDGLRLVSNSDAHSPGNIGREANILAGEPSYGAIREALQTGRGFLGTVEFFPQEGKYHHDGHRACGVNIPPEETLRLGGRCPVCQRRLTVGVLHRVQALADRPVGTRPAGAASFFSLIPLAEIVAETLGVGPASRAVQRARERLLAELGNEYGILLEAPLPEIARAGSPRLAEAIGRVRAGRVSIVPGFDGEYGKIRIFESEERVPPARQASLF